WAWAPRLIFDFRFSTFDFARMTLLTATLPGRSRAPELSRQVWLHQLPPKRVAFGIHVQAVLDINLRTRLAIRTQHLTKDIDESEPVGLAIVFNQVVGRLDLFHLAPAGRIGRDGNVGQARGRQLRVDFSGELFEIGKDLFRGFTRIDVVAAGVEDNHLG